MLTDPESTSDQAEPFQCITVPASPTAQTSLAALPHSAWMVLLVGLLARLQLPPVQCRSEPPLPPAQTSLGPLPQTALRMGAVENPIGGGTGEASQLLPPQWWMRPPWRLVPWPTAQTSVDEEPQTPLC